MHKGEATVTLPNGGAYTSACGHHHRNERRARRCAGRQQARISRLLEQNAVTGVIHHRTTI